MNYSIYPYHSRHHPPIPNKIPSKILSPMSSNLLVSRPYPYPYTNSHPNHSHPHPYLQPNKHLNFPPPLITTSSLPTTTTNPTTTTTTTTATGTSICYQYYPTPFLTLRPMFEELGDIRDEIGRIGGMKGRGDLSGEDGGGWGKGDSEEEGLEEILQQEQQDNNNILQILQQLTLNPTDPNPPSLNPNPTTSTPTPTTPHQNLDPYLNLLTPSILSSILTNTQKKLYSLELHSQQLLESIREVKMRLEEEGKENLGLRSRLKELEELEREEEKGEKGGQEEKGERGDSEGSEEGRREGD